MVGKAAHDLALGRSGEQQRLVVYPYLIVEIEIKKNRLTFYRMVKRGKNGP